MALTKCAAVCVGAVMLSSVEFSATPSPQRVQQLPVPLQPLAQHASRIEAALSYLGQPLAPADRRAIDDALAVSDEEEGVLQLQSALDKYVLAAVRINPESRVSVEQGPATPELVEGGTRLFLVKVLNEAQVTAPLSVESPNHGDVFIRSNGSPEPPRALSARDVRDRWMSVAIYDKRPMTRRL